MSILINTIREAYFPDETIEESLIKIGKIFKIDKVLCDDVKRVENTIVNYLKFKRKIYTDITTLGHYIIGGDVLVLKYKYSADINKIGVIEFEERDALDINGRVIFYEDMSAVEKFLIENYESAFVLDSLEYVENLPHSKKIEKYVKEFSKIHVKYDDNIQVTMQTMVNFTISKTTIEKYTPGYICRHWRNYIIECEENNKPDQFRLSLNSYMNKRCHLQDENDKMPNGTNLFSLPGHLLACEIWQTTKQSLDEKAKD